MEPSTAGRIVAALCSHSRELLPYPGRLLLEHIDREGISECSRHGVAVDSQELVRVLHQLSGLRDVLKVELKEVQRAPELCDPMRRGTGEFHMERASAWAGHRTGSAGRVEPPYLG